MKYKIMKYKARIILLFFIILYFIFLSLSQAQYMVIVDMAKNSVKIPTKIERVITLDPFSTQIMIGLNLTNLLVDAQYGTNLIGEGFKKNIKELENWGSSFSGNNVIIEKLIEKKPDLVISQIGRPDIKKIMDIGIPVVQIEVENDQSFIGALNLCGDIFQQRKRAAEISKYLTIAINEFYNYNSANKNNKNKPKIYIAGSNLLRSFGNASFQSWLVSIAGGVFVTDVYKQLKVDINPENLIKFNPDYLVLSKYTSESIDQIINDQRFSNINAVKNKKIYRFPSFVISWDLPSFEMIAGVLFLKYIIGNLSVDDYIVKIKDLYKIIYNIELDQKDIENLLIFY